MKIHSKILFFLWIAFTLLGLTPTTKAMRESNPQHNHYRLIIQKTSLRFILSSQKPLKYQSQRLANPSRFVLIIPQVQLKGSGKKTQLTSELVKSFQISQQKNGALHITFDLTKPSIKPRIHTESRNPGASGSYQLVLEFSKSGGQQKLDIPSPREFPFIAGSLAKNNIRSKNNIKHSSPPPQTKIFQTAPEPLIRGKREIMIVVDPGHGGKDPGAIGRSGLHEKTVVLNIAKRLARTLNRQPGFRAKLTRQGDYYIGLRERLIIARRSKADLFISIHADAFHNPASHGVSIFALSQRGATSEAARWLAHRENVSETLGDEKLANKDQLLSSVLINLSQNHTITESLKVGENMLIHFNSFSKLHHRHVEQAAFVVLKSPDIPSLLVETGFLSNRHEERRLMTPWYQERIAHALMTGIKEYFIKNPPPGTLIAARRVRY